MNFKILILFFLLSTFCDSSFGGCGVSKYTMQGEEDATDDNRGANLKLCSSQAREYSFVIRRNVPLKIEGTKGTYQYVGMSIVQYMLATGYLEFGIEIRIV